MDSFAIHGGTPINLYILDLPRYSVDVDLTYIPIKPREDSFADIHKNLAIIKEKKSRRLSRILSLERSRIKSTVHVEGGLWLKLK